MQCSNEKSFQLKPITLKVNIFLSAQFLGKLRQKKGEALNINGLLEKLKDLKANYMIRFLRDDFSNRVLYDFYSDRLLKVISLFEK